MRIVITLLVPDRVGILNEITGVVSDLGGNIESISQTVVAAYFTVTLVASFSEEIGITAIGSTMRERFGGKSSVVGVVPYAPPEVITTNDGNHYVVTLMGPERPGILKVVTTFMAEHHINIDDWYFILSLPNVTHVGQITVPSILDFGHVQNELAETMRKIGITARIQHENIFHATNEIGPIKTLLTGGRHV